MTPFLQDAAAVGFLDDINGQFGRPDITYNPFVGSFPGTSFALVAPLKPPDPRDDNNPGHFGTLIAQLQDFADAEAANPLAGDEVQIGTSTYKVYKVGPPEPDGSVLIHLHVK